MQYAFLAGLLLLFGFLSTNNYQRAIDNNNTSYALFVSGQLRAYGSYVAAYARANPGFDGNVTDAAAGVPAWLHRPTGMVGWAKAGKAFAYFAPSTTAQAFEFARNCGGSLTCGVTRSGSLYLPGESSPVSITLPSAIPANGALVLVL